MQTIFNPENRWSMQHQEYQQPQRVRSSPQQQAGFQHQAQQPQQQQQRTTASVSMGQPKMGWTPGIPPELEGKCLIHSSKGF
jgi:hypothetical protein